MLDFPNRASKYLPQLMQWSDKMPNANLALLGRDNQVGDICFLEFDQGTLAEAAVEMCQSVPVTRIHISGGKGLEHCAFKQTERSLNLGNRSANRNGQEWFSLRMHNRYVLGPGSIHPDSGRPYTVGNDIEPSDFPNWLVEWINKYTVSEFDAAGGKDMPEVSEDFDFDAFREYLPFSLSQDGYWYIVSECRGVGRKHQHSKKTGIFWDGTKLGWKCFAQFCPWAYKENGRKFTIGDVIHALAEEIGAYDGVIWPEQEDDFSDFADSVEATDAMPELVPAKPNGHAGVTPELASVKSDECWACHRTKAEGCICIGLTKEEVTGSATKVKLAAEARRKSEKALEAESGVVEVVEPAEELVSLPAAPTSSIPPFPEDCLCGKLGEYAKMIEMPLGIAYPAIIGCYSVIPEADEFCRSRINTDVCLICPPGGGKNECIKRGLLITGVPYGNGGYKRTTPGGDRQLMELVGDRPGRKRGDPRIPGPKKLLMVNNEIADVLKKAAHDKSSLSSRLCDLWDENLTEIPDYRGGTITADCRLSWIGGLPATLNRQERFLELFNAESIHGLYERFIFGYTDEEWIHHDWTPPIVARDAIIDLEHTIADYSREVNPFVRDFTVGAFQMYEQWRADIQGFGRVRYNLKKWALLTAAADGLELCGEVHMEKAIRWTEWQICVRRVFQPSEALAGNREAAFVNLLVPALLEKGAAVDFVSWRRLALDRKWDKQFDPSLQNRTVDALIKMGRLEQEEKELKNGSKKKTAKVKVRA